MHEWAKQNSSKAGGVNWWRENNGERHGVLGDGLKRAKI